MSHYPFVITVSSEKGGVGKTTLATNLAIFLKALRDDLSITVFSFDNHFTVDKMFAIAGQKERGTVAELIKGTPGRELLHTGQYGVNYIPSSSALSQLRGSMQGPMTLAKLLATSDIPGIVVIDTRPELDILTENALYAADQVFIPVKDMASLENCRNIFGLFDSRGLDKRSLALIPCLIDSRVKFDGIFRDQKTLLKAFAINRGFRCLDVAIAKSPKVDSLNTNPEGKIYPILSHARGTDVFGQFLQVAKQVLFTFSLTGESRSMQFRKWLESEEERCSAAFSSRISMLKPHCPVCGIPTFKNAGHPPGHYYETGDGGNRGFINGACFFDLMASILLPNGNSLGASDPLGQLLQDATVSSTFLFRPVSNGGKAQVELSIIESTGRQILQQRVSCGDFSESSMNRREGRLHQMLSATLGPHALSREEAFLVVHPVNGTEPESILKEDEYRRFRKMRQRYTAQPAAN